MKTRLLIICVAFVGFATGQTTIGKDINFDDPDEEHLLTTYRGDQFLGHMHWLRNDSLGFQIASLPDTLIFQLSEVQYVGQVGSQPIIYRTPDEVLELDLADDPRYALPLHQLLYSSTALPYETKGSYKNTMLFVSQGEYTPNKHFGISAGAFIPPIAMVKVRASMSLAEVVHIGAAWHQYWSFFDFDSPTPSHPYAILTIGKPKQYINVTYGVWMHNDDNRNQFSDQENFPIVTVGASYAFADNWRFFTEIAALIDDNQGVSNPIYPSFFVSNLKRRRTLDFGLFAIPESDVGVFPALSLTYLFK